MGIGPEEWKCLIVVRVKKPVKAENEFGSNCTYMKCVLKDARATLMVGSVFEPTTTII